MHNAIKGALSAALAFLAAGCFMTSHAPRHFTPTTRTPAAAAPPTDGAIYRTGYGMDLFADLKARHVGDVLTIKLQESTNATKNATTKTSKKTSLVNTGPTLFGKTYTNNGVPLFNASLDGSHSFDGAGASTQSNSLAGSITVTVVDVQPNGNLVVQGEKSLQLNHGDEYVRIAGVVRPADIATDNTVGSDKIADARISYSGKGPISASNRMGWLARFFNSAAAPF